MWTDHFPDVCVVRYGHLKLDTDGYLDTWAKLLNVSAFPEVPVHPVNNSIKGWRFEALKAMNAVVGTYDMAKGRNHMSRFRKMVAGR